jgi:GNAT superfamily N-acetyltransferase
VQEPTVNINERSYRNRDDLLQIGLLIRRAYAKAPYWNAWSFARFDIWAQRRIGDENVHGKRDWQQDIRLWEKGSGELAAAVLFESDQDAAVILDPGQPGLFVAMLAWAEAHYATKGVTDKLSIEVMESNTVLGQAIQARGYTSLFGHYIHREKQLGDDHVESVSLPPGFVLKPIETLEDMKRFHVAVKAVFDFQDSVEVYQIVQQAPSFVAELDLIGLSETGEVAAFCTAWLDKENSVAEFEPVGTAPGYRKRGLAAALLAEASNRLRSLGCKKAIVNSWSESVGANKLYSAAGLAARDKLIIWQKP